MGLGESRRSSLAPVERICRLHLQCFLTWRQHIQTDRSPLESPRSSGRGVGAGCTVGAGRGLLTLKSEPECGRRWLI